VIDGWSFQGQAGANAGQPPPPPRGERAERAERSEVAEKPQAITSISTASEPAPAAAEASGDPKAIRTLIVSGLPKDVTKAVLWKKVRKVNDQLELVYPVEGEVDTGTCLLRVMLARVY
jgi:hypothetical protein